MDTQRADPLAEGRRALEAAQWDSARAALEAALEVEPSPDARDGLGLALWFLGEVEEGITAREGRWEDCRREILAMAERRNEASDGSLFMNAEYLIAAGRKAA
jgi:uncharacterized protein HemY